MKDSKNAIVICGYSTQVTLALSLAISTELVQMILWEDVSVIHHGGVTIASIQQFAKTIVATIMDFALECRIVVVTLVLWASFAKLR